MEEIYKQNAKIVYQYLYSMCKDEKLAEDLTQDTFLHAYESIERYDGSCKLSTWLCQIGKHLLRGFPKICGRAFAGMQGV